MDDNATSPPVVLITGAAGGLGRVLVERFLETGWRVAAGEHSKHVHQTHDQLRAVPLDVTSKPSIENAVRDVTDDWRRLDVLINNAGIIDDAPCVKLSPDQWQRVLDVNLKGAMLCSQAVLRIMSRQRRGHLINISSYAARNGHAGQSNYVAAKAGLIGLTQSLAREMGGRNIRVNAIFPGVLETPLTRALTSEQRDRLQTDNVLGRSTTLDEVARFIEHLARMEHVSGQTFQLDSRIGAWT